jgi:hypothetical protein
MSMRKGGKFMVRKVMFALLLTSVASTASFAGTFFVGGSWGNSQVKANDGFDGTDSAWKIYAGYNFLKFFGVEGGYVDFGAPDDNGVDVDATAWDAFAKGMFGIGPLDLFAKVGIASWDADFHVGPGSFSDSGSDPAYGIGAEFHFSHVGVRGEWELFDVDHTDNVYLFTLGANWRF